MLMLKVKVKAHSFYSNERLLLHVIFHILTFLLLLIFNFPYFIMKIYRLSAVIRYMHVM